MTAAQRDPPPRFAPLLPLVLASASERRHRILERLGIPFEIVPAGVDETPPPGASPADTARELALRKARHVARDLRAGTVLGADTVVALGTEQYAKPEDEGDARRILRALSGTTHEVITGIALVHPRTGVEAAEIEVTRVTMRPMTGAEIDAYVASGEPFGKAGAYAIQEHADRFVSRVDGDYDNVVGLPAMRLEALLERFARDVTARSGR